MIQNLYGKIAVEAVSLVKIHGISPEEAWDVAKSNYVNAKSNNQFSYQKEVFLSLCAAKLINGIDAPIPLKKLPSEKAERIANLILEFPDLLDKQIWDILKRTEENSVVPYIGCQMDVSVIRALLLEELLVFSIKKQKTFHWIEKGNWTYRIDKEDSTKKAKRHIHVCHKKHKSAKEMQVSWNIDGSRHDKKTFHENIVGMNTAKEIASKHLRIPIGSLQLIIKIDYPADNASENYDFEIFIFEKS